MIDMTEFTQTVELDVPLVFSMVRLAPPDEPLAGGPWPGWFSPDDDRDGGHSDR